MSTSATPNIKEPSSATNNITLTSGGDTTISGNATISGTPTLGGLTYPTADCTANQVLKTDGSGTLSFANNITHSTVQSTASGSTGIEFTDVPTGVKKITVIFDDVGTNLGSSEVRIELSTGGTYLTSGYTSTSIRTQSGATPGNDTLTTGLIVGRLDNANKALTGAVTIYNVTGNRWLSSGLCVCTGDQNRSWQSGGFIDVGGVIDKLRVVGHGSAYTWDSGQINVMYES